MSGQQIGKEGLLSKLIDLDINADTIDHPAVFTVEEAIPHVAHLDGMFAKNLFMKDKKKKLWLLCAPHNADVKLNDLCKMVKASGSLRFADESVLLEKLGLRQGAVTLFGLINDTNKDVTLILDSRFTENVYPKIHFHPMVNSATTGITSEDLKKFIEHTGHKPIIVKLD
ncbi:prolyl-tRNA synthetase associated domain-containing protein 1 [Patella vulgata]|uniref:prolyl-tRNA synthetase associated domain-containing protein 1 n=1 Tax=Patella vulgata TaxID=6465 RepID=UPI00217F881A|nr:prolyl-tRNA synthetase associated domain-containing protein 1 [Patella vulgata]